MATIIKTYTESAPACRFIGLRYGEAQRVDGSFAHLWNSWFAHQRFDALYALLPEGWGCPEAGSPLGLMRHQEGQPFEYWIGLCLPPDSSVPAGYDSLDLPAMPLGVCWVQGQEPAIYHQDEQALAMLGQMGLQPGLDPAGFFLVMERYQSPRFSKPDEEGQRILDLVFLLEGEVEDPASDQADIPLQDPAGLFYCPACRKAYAGEACPECHKKGSPLDAQDPIFIGELPGRLRNALQIAFGATQIPFNALSSLGSGFTLSAGEIFESYRIYVPFERSDEAKAAFRRVFEINKEPLHKG